MSFCVGSGFDMSMAGKDGDHDREKGGGNEEQMETNLQTNGRNGSHCRVEGRGEHCVVMNGN